MLDAFLAKGQNKEHGDLRVMPQPSICWLFFFHSSFISQCFYLLPVPQGELRWVPSKEQKCSLKWQQRWEWLAYLKQHLSCELFSLQTISWRFVEQGKCLPFVEFRDNGAFFSLAKRKLTGGSLHFKLLFKIFAYELYREKKSPHPGKNGFLFS